jgi:hypothetical protein
MRWLLIVACWLVCHSAQAAPPVGRIDGLVASGGVPVAGAPVQAKDDESGATFRAFSAADGTFSLERVPASDYTLSVRMPGYKYVPFAMPVKLKADARQSVAVDLAIGNLDTIADDPASYLSHLRDGAAALTQPAPRTADGHPDLSGIWFGNDDLFPDDPTLRPWAAQRMRQRLANDMADLPRGQCLPASAVQIGPFFRKFVQTPGLLVVLNEDDVLGYRQIFLDGRGHPEDLSPSWQGHSVARWDGDVLVADAVGFNESSVIGFLPHTGQLHVTERYHRRDYGHMDVQLIVEDAGTFEQPWIINMAWDLTPDQELNEYVCTESILNMHLEWRADFQQLRDEILKAAR